MGMLSSSQKISGLRHISSANMSLGASIVAGNQSIHFISRHFRMTMYIDLILGGQVAQNIAGGSILLWMDNFSAHRTPDIDTLLTERNVYAAMYPENMTAHLQVLDLIVNGPIKRHIRACRSHELVDKFQMLKAEYEAAIFAH